MKKEPIIELKDITGLIVKSLEQLEIFTCAVLITANWRKQMTNLEDDIYDLIYQNVHVEDDSCCGDDASYYIGGISIASRAIEEYIKENYIEQNKRS